MNYPMGDPSRQRGMWYQKLGAPRDPRVTIADENLAASEDVVRGKLRRQRLIGSAIALLAFALLAAFLIFRLLTQ